MQRVALRAVVDLVAAGGAVGDDQRVRVGLADGGQQRKLAHRQRDVDGVGAIAERARHAAAAQLHGLDFSSGTSLQDALDRADHAERLLVAMAVHQRALRERLERQVEPAGRRLAHQKFLEHQRVHRELRRASDLIIAGSSSRKPRMQLGSSPTTGTPRATNGATRRDHPLGLALCLIDTADRKERAAAAERPLEPSAGLAMCTV